MLPPRARNALFVFISRHFTSDPRGSGRTKRRLLERGQRRGMMRGSAGRPPGSYRAPEEINRDPELR